MKRQGLIHYVLILTIVAFSQFWSNQPTLQFYTLQLIAAALVFSFLTKILRKSLSPVFWGMVSLLFVTLIVFSTGNLASPFFFLIFFLLFGFAFLFSPATSLFLAATLVLFLLPSAIQLEQLFTLFSLILIAPLSYLFGKQYLLNLKESKRVKIYQKQWLMDEQQLEKTQADTLLWLSLKLKPNLEAILDKTSQLLADISHLTPSQKTLLKSIRRLTRKLLKGAEKLERSVETNG